MVRITYVSAQGEAGTVDVRKGESVMRRAAANGIEDGPVRAGGAPVTIRSVVIVGTGQAGFQTAASLRQEGFEGEIVMIGDEPGLPYQRPPLSKAYIKEGDAERLLLRSRDFYDKNRISLVEGRVARIDREGRAVELEDGCRVGYDHLVLAVGARNRRPPIPGVELDGVMDLRTLRDADRLRAALEAAERVVVVGGGFIGLEIAATAAGLGRRVMVLEAADRLMSRSVSPETSEHFLAAHRRFGVEVRLGAKVAAVEDRGDGRAGGVVLSDGARAPGDLVLVAVGVGPNLELARAAGLETADGIVVDDQLLTTDQAISALGDCAAFPHRTSGARTRLESVQNAVDQAKCVARRIVGRAAGYDAVAWFWSDQGDRKLQIAGLAAGADRRVARGSEDGAKLTVFAFQGDALVGVETVNVPADHMAARKALALAPPPDFEALDRAGFDLRAVLRERGAAR